MANTQIQGVPQEILNAIMSALGQKQDIASPIPERNVLSQNPGLQYYAGREAAGSDPGYTSSGSEFQPKTIQYPAWMANAPANSSASSSTRENEAPIAPVLPQWFEEKMPGTKTTYKALWQAVVPDPNQTPSKDQIAALQKLGAHKTQGEIDKLMSHAKTIGAQLPAQEKEAPAASNAQEGGFWGTIKNIPSEVKEGLVNEFENAVNNVASKYGIHPAVLKGIAAEETNTGAGRTPTGYAARNNFYDIGAFDSNPDNAYQYQTPQQGVEAFAKLMSTDPRYAKAYAARNNPMQMVQEMKNAGYATDPNYVQKVVNTPEFSKSANQPIPQPSQQPQRPIMPPAAPSVHPVASRSFSAPIPQKNILAKNFNALQQPQQQQQQPNLFQGIGNAIGGLFGGH